MNPVKRVGLIALVAVLALAGYAAFNNYNASALNNATTTTDPVTRDMTAQLRDGDAEGRALAANALAGSDDPAATTALIATLGDEDPTVGYNSALALSESPLPVVSDSLVAELSSDSAATRQRAALALSEMESIPAPAVSALAAVLDDSETSMMAATALVRANTPAAHQALMDALADEALSTRRHAAMAAIEGAEPMVADSILAQALASNNAILVRNATQLRDFIQNSR